MFREHIFTFFRFWVCFRHPKKVKKICNVSFIIKKQYSDLDLRPHCRESSFLPSWSEGKSHNLKKVQISAEKGILNWIFLNKLSVVGRKLHFEVRFYK